MDYLNFIVKSYVAYIFFSILICKEISDKPHFLSINPNNKSKELKMEIKNLQNDYDSQMKKIEDYYQIEMQRLKENRGNDISELKTIFKQKRDDILYKYGQDKKIRNKPNSVQKSENKPIRKKK